MRQFILFIVITLLLASCKCSSDNNPSSNIKANNLTNKQLNISILLDLSDRISPEINPLAKKYDIENIKTITEIFKSNMADLGAYKAKGKIQVFLKPTPIDANINATISNLMIDCSKMDNKGRKYVYDNLTELYITNLEGIYQLTITTSGWLGSDIWRFFNDEVKDLCIESDINYRNILIVLTDGYLYHPDSQDKYESNRYSFLTKNIQQYRRQDWKQMIEKDDFGIKTERTDLNDLEVLVLELKAPPSSPKLDEDILAFLWKKWFSEMNITHYEVYPSSEPVYTKKRIEKFFLER
jgi:hypothetical protein